MQEEWGRVLCFGEVESGVEKDVNETEKKTRNPFLVLEHKKVVVEEQNYDRREKTHGFQGSNEHNGIRFFTDE